MKKEIEEINNVFKNNFQNYNLEQSVNITSGIDSSVVFIGSAISVFKQMMLNEKIDKIGNIIFQRAIRTRSLKRIQIPEKLEWSSYFDSLGVISNYKKLENIIYDSLTFLKESLETDFNNLVIRINSEDFDMLNAINNLELAVQIEQDTMPKQYYRHKYGLDDYGIYGRNFNIAFKHKDAPIAKDIGNIIVIENPEKKYGVEFALGSNAIIMRKQNILTSLEASSIADIINITNPEELKFAECVSVVSHLAYENVESIKNDRSKIYLYRKYLKALEYWSKKLNINISELTKIIEKYIILEYNNFNEEEIQYNLKLLKK